MIGENPPSAFNRKIGEQHGKSEERGRKARAADEQSDTKRTTESDDSSGGDDAKDAAGKSANQGDTTDASKKSAEGSREDRNAGDATGARDTQKATGEKTATDSAKRVDLTGDKRTRVQAALRSKGDIERRTGATAAAE